MKDIIYHGFSSGYSVSVVRVECDEGFTYTVQSGEHYCSGLTIEEARTEIGAFGLNANF